MRTYEPSPGEAIWETCVNLTMRAAIYRDEVCAEFNGSTIIAKPGTTAESLEQGWRADMERRRAEYEASDAGKAAKLRQAEFEQRAAESAAIGIVDFDVSDPAAWNKWREANEDGGYGEGCLRYAARWANVMETRIANGDKLEDIADATSHEADTEGISGFMYGAAVSILASCWRHGEALRKWHNLKTQIRDEGEKANVSGAVLNPAVLAIG